MFDVDYLFSETSFLRIHAIIEETLQNHDQEQVMSSRGVLEIVPIIAGRERWRCGLARLSHQFAKECESQSHERYHCMTGVGFWRPPKKLI
jgi:hypothetical protein